MTVPPDSSPLARQLQEVRVQTGKSLKELERITSASDSSLSRYFTGAACPPWSVVEALCRAADRDPEELRASWEDARRARLKRYYPEPDGKPDDGTGKDTPPASRRKRIVALVVAIAAVAALAGAGYFWLVIPESPAQKRFCPWRYVVTDGDPAPVRIADRPGANRRHIAKTYAPDEVFYAPEPAQVMNEMMRTVDGWVTQGDWIQRAPGECVLRPG